MITRINSTIYKYYVTTWVLFLILLKREVPEWLRSNAKDIIEIETIVGQSEKYVK